MAWACAMSASLASSTPAKASKSSRWFCSATRTGRMRRASSGSRRASSSTMKSNSTCRVARAGPASARTSWLSHWVSVRMSRASPCAWVSVCRASSNWGQLVVRTTLAGAADLGLQLLAPRRGALGEARQRVGEAFALALDVKHIAMARRVVPGGPLPGAQALPGIGNRVVRLQSLLGGVEQMHAPGVGVAMLRRSQEIAVGRRGIDAGQHRRRTLEDLVVQAHANARQVLRRRLTTPACRVADWST